MASNFGTTQKCSVCDKTVYFIEMVSADGIPYHKACFKCCHCNGRLALSNFSHVEGKLYCKPHFEQLFKETGSFTSKKTKGELTKTTSKASSMFSGTQDKCQVCKKTVYPLEKVTVEGEFYHKNCFRCAHAGCHLSPSNYAALDGILYCKPHFAQLFKEKGSYSHLTETTTQKKAHDEAEAAATAADEQSADDDKPADDDDKPADDNTEETSKEEKEEEGGED